MDMNSSKPWDIVKDREAWHDAVHSVAKIWHDLVTEQHQRGSQEEILVWFKSGIFLIPFYIYI